MFFLKSQVDESGTAAKLSLYCLEIMSLNPVDVTSSPGRESKRANLAVLVGGVYALCPVNHRIIN